MSSSVKERFHTRRFILYSTWIYMKISNIDKYLEVICVTVFYHLHKSPFNTIFYCSYSSAHITKGICTNKLWGTKVPASWWWLKMKRNLAGREIISGTNCDGQESRITNTSDIIRHARKWMLLLHMRTVLYKPFYHSP